MDSIDTYIENSNHPESIEYKHPLLRDIISVTYGCIVYQEQVMQIVRKLAGYSFGRADLVRRAMAKKKADVMQKEREIFIFGDGKDIKGAVANGVPQKTAEEIFDQMASFASYAFNKSHATAYAVLAYRTAYLKYYYPCEYMAALMTSVIERPEKISEYINECKEFGIRVMPPDINESYDGFSSSGNMIRFGLGAVKNVGKGIINKLVAERNQNGKFTSLGDFCVRMANGDINKRAVESLIKAGCFDSFGITRRGLMIAYEPILEDISYGRHKNIEGQIDLFETSGEDKVYSYPKVDEYEKEEFLKSEKEAIGFYISGHPFSDYKIHSVIKGGREIFDVVSSFSSEDGRYKDGDKIRISGIITEISTKNVKSGRMCFLTLEDIGGNMEILVFPNVYSAYSSYLAKGNAVSVFGSLSAKEEEAPKLLADDISLLIKDKNINRIGVTTESLNDKRFAEFRSLVKENPGEIPVSIKVISEKKIYKSNKITVNPSAELISEIKRILGNDNVYLG